MSFTVSIQKIVTETPRVKSFYFKYPLKAEPGQFLDVTIPTKGKRPFGAVIADENTFLISVGKVGEGTEYLHQMQEGDELTIDGPKGTYFTLPSEKSTLCLVAGGYGMAPLGFLAKKAVENGHDVTIFVGARTENEFLIYPFLKQSNITIIKTTDDGSTGIQGLVTDAFAEACKENKYSCAYIVGPSPMQKLAAEICEENDIPYQVSIAEYAYEEFGPVMTGDDLQKIRKEKI